MAEVTPAAKPLPRPAPESRPFWEGAAAHRLVLPRCASCSQFWFPPSKRCPHCLSGDFAWVETKGTGRIYSFVIYHRVYHPGFAGEVPYIVAIVELDEGPRLLSNIVGTPPDGIVCDLRVQVLFDDVADGITLPKFSVSP